MTLVEVVIAIALAAMLSAGMYGSTIYTMRQTAKNVEHIYAMLLANSEVASLRVSRFNKVTADPGTLATGDYEKRFAEPRTVTMDPHTAQSSQTFTVTHNLSGFGKGVQSTGSGSTRLTLGANSVPWTANLYRDHLLVITGGRGVNQVMRITGHGASTGATDGKGGTVDVQLTSDLTGGTTTGWIGNTPNSESTFAVDYGLYSDVEVSWDNGEGYKTVTETVYVPMSQ